MRTPLFLSKVTLCCSLLVSLASAGQPLRIMHAEHVDVPPKIDGQLNDSAWQQADWQNHFLQREPEEGAPGTEPTFVAVVYDQRALYIGVRCQDSAPEQIVAREKRRDASLDQDDNFQIVLDTYHDHRTGYYFVVNPLGARRDAMLSNEGRVFNPEWDGLWQCKAHITPEGWVAEIAVPWSTLRFPRGDTLTMGINFLREIRRRDEQQYWQLVPRGQGFFGLARLSLAGELTGIAGLRNHGHTELRPYVLGGFQRDEETAFQTFRQSNIGLDVKFTPSSNLTLDLTWNTDFAQVEADYERVNLTRFSLYYPEKREFFLENAELFSFGPAGGGHRRVRPGPLQIFYSRRIGLAGGRTVPILGGMRLTGKQGRTRLGLLNVTTDRTELPDSTVEPRTNFTAVRLKRDVFQRSSVGVMFLNRQDLDEANFNRTLGMDATLAPSAFTYLDIAGAATSSPDPGVSLRNASGWYARSGYRSDLWAFSFSHLAVGGAFDPEMGFLRRKNIRTFSSMLRYMPRPSSLPGVRKFFYTLRGVHVRNHSGTTLDQNLEASFGIRFQNSVFLTLGAERFYEFLDYDWSIRPGIVVPSGVYEGTRVSFRFRGNESKAVIPLVQLTGGDSYNGRMMTVNPQTTLTLLPNTRIEIGVSYNRVQLPWGSFSASTAALRFIYYFSTNLYFKAFLQLRDDPLANEGQKIGLANLLLRWTVRDGTDLYVVYNQGVASGLNRYAVQNRVLLAKFVWLVMP